MLSRSRWLATACAFALAAAVPAQNSLTTLSNSNNSGDVGGTIFFDLAATGPVVITSLDTNFTAAVGTRVGLTVYTTPGTYLGNETNPSVWTRVVADDGSAVAAGRNQPTKIALGAPFTIPTGAFGVALVAFNSAHAYTDGNGSNQTYSDPNLTLTAGAAAGGPLSGTVFTPRVWNGTLFYRVGQGLLPAFDASTRRGAAPLTVQFTDRSFSSAGASAWAWDFDNDGTIDSRVQNPTWQYAAGNWTVALTVTDPVNGTATLVRPNFVSAVTATNNTRSAPILEYQFNEVRGTRVANSAGATFAPAHGTVINAGWHGDPGRKAFRGSEPGFGCLSNTAGARGRNLVNTGWPLEIWGDMTVMWWHRQVGTVAAIATDVFGGPGSGVRCFTGGIYGQLLVYTGSPIGVVPTASSIQANQGTWQHTALVVDDQGGKAHWYLNGVLDSTTSFLPGTHRVLNNELTIGYHSTGAGAWVQSYDLDDFRLYARTMSQADIQTAMKAENPSTSTYGASCAGPATEPKIDASGGAPAVGNAAFRIETRDVEAGRSAFLIGGIKAHDRGRLPLDIGWLLGAGCKVECSIEAAAPFNPTGGAGSFPMPIPNNAALAGGHVYFQVVVIGTKGAVSEGLDVNVQL